MSQQSTSTSGSFDVVRLSQLIGPQSLNVAQQSSKEVQISDKPSEVQKTPDEKKPLLSPHSTVAPKKQKIEAAGPGAIKRLDPNVVNKIAAGEILHGPANAIKELLENSLDASATVIRIIVKEGGIKLIQIQDNGKGIHKDDFKIVCERHTTSKLENFSDLNQLTTFGFRGEALASISYVSHVTIASMTAGSKCAFKASFSSGKMIGDPKPLAGTVGTQVIAEDLFYNVPPRRKGLGSPKDEYQKVYDVIAKYALHCDGVGISLKKHGDQSNHLTTQPNLTKLEKIRLIYGDNIARETLHVVADKEKLDPAILVDFEAWTTNANFNMKKLNLIIFINNRLVESLPIKKAIEHVYLNFLPKGTHPFCYMKLSIPPDKLDVNVHPTKSEIIMLNQDYILDVIQISLTRKLVSNDTSRSFSAQPIGISTNSTNQIAMLTSLERTRAPSKKQQLSETQYQSNKIRNDPKIQTLHVFLNQNQLKSAKENEDNQTQRQLTSVKKLQNKIVSSCHQPLRDLFTNCTFVGCVDSVFALLQHKTKLYLVNTFTVSKHIMYQIALNNFRSYPPIEFRTPLPILQLLEIGVETSDVDWPPEYGAPKEIARILLDSVISSRAEMLAEYFSIRVENGHLLSLPQLLENYQPNMAHLGTFLVNLATQTIWDSEEECLDCIFQILAEMYCFHPDPEIDEFASSSHESQSNTTKSEITNNNSNDQNNNCSENENSNYNQNNELTEMAKGGVQSEKYRKFNLLLEHTFTKSLSKFFPPPELAKNGAVVQIASTEKLYQQFDRC